MVRGAGLEPARETHQILNLARLPIPPPSHCSNFIIITGYPSFNRPPLVSYSAGNYYFTFMKLKKILKFAENIDTIQSVWPVSFKAIALISLALRKGAFIFRGDPDEFSVIARDVNENGLVRAVIFGEKSWEMQVRKDIPTVFLLDEDEDAEPVYQVFSNLVVFNIKRGDLFDPGDIIKTLVDSGYSRVPYVETEGEFSLRGGILDIFPMGEELPVRLEFFGDEVESIRIFDPVSQRSIREISEFPLNLIIGGNEKQKIPEIVEISDTYARVEVEPVPRFKGRIDLLEREIEEKLKMGWHIIFVASDKGKVERFTELFPEVDQDTGYLSAGFAIPGRKVEVISEADITGVKIKKRKLFTPGERIEDYNLLKIGDYVVHEDYGIGRFRGLKTLEHQGVKYECLFIEYKDGEILVPTYNLEKIQRYVGAREDYEPALSSISGTQWALRKAKALVSAFKYAEELLKIHARRKARRGFAFKPDTVWEREFELTFPFEETEDQLKTLEEVKRDMESENVMDRLIVGEVGFGKTEIALRAAFKAAINGKQTAVLVPTTILALQHFRTFDDRLKPFGIRVEMLSRLKSRQEVRKILGELAEGKIDVIIGTHRLLQPDVTFKDLGLLIIDEEHRFGVLQKEKIYRQYPEVDTLRMTATPIPRTLYAALGNIYDISYILKPPQGREAVETIVSSYSDDLVYKAVSFEVLRGGQVFYLYNRIQGIKEKTEKLKRMFPTLKIEYAHGRMKKEKLEDIFIKFMNREIDLLVSTSIIESGIDFPNANTLIVENAHLFGLAELHQLRGRVGRSERKAFAYFLVPKNIGSKARERLKAIARFHHLGSGLKIALADLEIRGAGNLLGKEQHGHANAIGFELYFKLLEEAVRKIKGEEIPVEPEIVVNTTLMIPESYIQDPMVRIAFYRRLMRVKSVPELLEIQDEMKDRFGRIPEEVKKIFFVVKVKLWAATQGYRQIIVNDSNVQLVKDGKKSLYSNNFLERKLRKYVEAAKHEKSVIPNNFDLPA